MIVILNASHLLITLFYFTWLVTKQHFISLESLTKLCDGLDAFNENDEAVCIKQLLIIRTLSRTDIFKIFELSHSKKEKLNIIFFLILHSLTQAIFIENTVAMEVMKFRFKKCLLFSWRALIKNFVKITWHYCLNQKSYRW